MKLFIVSDLHIEDEHDPVYRALVTLLRSRAAAEDRVVLAGDLFDLFVGNKAIFRRRYSEFFDAVREAGARGVRVDYIEGNHDFLIRKAFSGMPNVTLYPREIRFEAGGKRFFIAHGDLVDRKDYGYRFLRGFFRSPVMKLFVASMPGEVIDWIGRRSSERSRMSGPRLPSELPTDRMERLRKTYRSYAAERLNEGYDFVVLGHCHDLDEKSFKIGNRSGQYINVGFPRVHGSMLSWEPGEERIQREAFR
jgi:UDP-2,3-diacylglucosamine hydrolase